MSQAPVLRVHNGEACPCRAVPQVGMADFRAHALAAVAAGARIVALFGMPRPDEAIRILLVLAQAETGMLSLPRPTFETTIRR